MNYFQLQNCPTVNSTGAPNSGGLCISRHCRLVTQIAGFFSVPSIPRKNQRTDCVGINLLRKLCMQQGSVLNMEGSL